MFSTFPLIANIVETAEKATVEIAKKVVKKESAIISRENRGIDSLPAERIPLLLDRSSNYGTTNETPKAEAEEMKLSFNDAPIAKPTEVKKLNFNDLCGEIQYQFTTITSMLKKNEYTTSIFSGNKKDINEVIQEINKLTASLRTKITHGTLVKNDVNTKRIEILWNEGVVETFHYLYKKPNTLAVGSKHLLQSAIENLTTELQKIYTGSAELNSTKPERAPGFARLSY